MNMIAIEPDGKVKSLPFKGEFSEIQKAVGGYVERIALLGSMPFRVDLFVDEEGIPKGMIGNLVASMVAVLGGVGYPISLYGKAVLVKPTRTGWTGLNKNETERLLDLLCKGLGAEREVNG